MSRAFHKGSSQQFIESRGKARGALRACPDGVTQVTQYIGFSATAGYVNSGGLPDTKARGRWRIHLDFKVFGTPPPLPLYPQPPGDYPLWNSYWKTDAVICFFRFDRNATGYWAEKGTLSGGPQLPYGGFSVDPAFDAWRDSQWIDGEWVKPGIPGRNWLSHSDDGQPHLAYQAGQHFSWPDGGHHPLDGGIFNRFSGRDEETATGQGWVYCLHYEPPFHPSLPRTACMNRATLIIPDTDMVTGYEWEEEIIAEEVPYCSPAWTIGARVSQGLYSSQPGWIAPAPSADNPAALAWRARFVATRIPRASPLFAAIKVSPNRYQFTNLTTFDQPLYDFTFTWAWDFGDGGSSSVQNPIHTYAAAGNYIVTLTVTNVLLGETLTHSALIVVSAT